MYKSNKTDPELFIQLTRATLPGIVSDYLKACKKEKISLDNAISGIDIGILPLNSREKLWVRSWLKVSNENSESFAKAWVSNFWRENTESFYTIPLPGVVSKHTTEPLYLIQSEQAGEYHVAPFALHDSRCYFTATELKALPTVYQQLAEKRKVLSEQAEPNQ